MTRDLAANGSESVRPIDEDRQRALEVAIHGGRERRDGVELEVVWSLVIGWCKRSKNMCSVGATNDWFNG